MPSADEISVSPYLLQPLRTYEQALRDRAELTRLRERALQTLRHQLQPARAAQASGAD